jgi:putative acetyltransferase
MAILDHHPVGCCALIPHSPGEFEVAKMAVAEGYRDRGIGRKVLEHTVEQAKAMGAKSLYLETNSKLENAIHLYESVGFKRIPSQDVVPSPYSRSNVSMRLRF